jgi:hypothetical protein
VVGPTAVGKSALSLLVHRCVNEYHRSKMEENPGFIPVITASLFHPEDPRSAWRSMYMGIMEVVEPLSTKKQADTKSSAFIQQSQRHTALALRMAAQSVAKHRGVELLQIDEGDALVAPGHGRDKEYQCNVLKSFLNTTKLPCIIYAPYPFFESIKQHTQLARRVKFIHFPPYGTSEDEILAFLKIAQEFIGELPLPVAPDFLDENSDLILEKTLCSVGLMKNLFRDAVVEAYRARSRQLRREHLVKAAMLESVLENLRLDILSGAVLFGDKLPEPRSGQQATPPPKPTRKPGQRHPTRDPLKNPKRGLV